MSQRRRDTAVLAAAAAAFAAAASGAAASRRRHSGQASQAVAEQKSQRPDARAPDAVVSEPERPSAVRSRTSRRAALAVAIAVVAAIGAVAEHSLESGGTSAGPEQAAVKADLSALPSDPEAGKAFPEPASSPEHPLARTPEAAAADADISEGAPSDEQVRRELRQLERIVGTIRLHDGGGRNPASLARDGSANSPSGAPDAVAQAIAGGNAIARFPYRFGGGHGSFVDNAYDCSGSVSYALAAAGLLDAPIDSGRLMRWGKPGPGQWITVYANRGHVYMEVAGLRFDTSGRDGRRGSRWQDTLRSSSGFVARHPPGL